MPKKDAAKTIPFSIRLTEDLKKDLESIAEKEYRSMNSLIRAILEEYVSNHK